VKLKQKLTVLVISWIHYKRQMALNMNKYVKNQNKIETERNIFTVLYDAFKSIILCIFFVCVKFSGSSSPVKSAIIFMAHLKTTELSWPNGFYIYQTNKLHFKIKYKTLDINLKHTKIKYNIMHYCNPLIHFKIHNLFNLFKTHRKKDMFLKNISKWLMVKFTSHGKRNYFII